MASRTAILGPVELYAKRNRVPSPQEFKALAEEVAQSGQLTTEQKFIASYLAVEIGQFESALAASIDNLDLTNPVEVAIGAYGASWLDYEIESKVFSAIDVLSMFQATDIPVFKTLHGWEVAFGNYWSYDADYARRLFIEAYDRGALNHADWVYELFVEKLHREGDQAAFAEALKILEDGADRGFIRSIGILAGMYQEGEGSLEPDDRLASRKFEALHIMVTLLLSWRLVTLT